MSRLKFVLILFSVVQSILLAGIGIGYFRKYSLMEPYGEVNVRNDYVDNSTESKADVKLILVSRMRSGSSFTGDLFNHHSQVFYFYEPLWTIDFYFERQQASHSIMMSPALFFRKPMIFKSTTTAHQQTSSLKQNVIKGIINCDFEQMYLGPLLVPELYDKSRTCKPFGECAARNPGVLGLYHCLPELEKVCRSASVIAMKVLRLKMRDVETFLKADPKVKIVHLVRDPRGVFLSRQKTGLDKFYQQTNTEFCNSVAEDVKDSMTLKEKYPGRVMRARYEDLAQWPQDFATELLNFAGLSMEPKLREYIWNITSSKKKREKEESYTTFRADSRRTAGLWRASASFEIIAGIDRDCRELRELMGYVTFANESALKNMEIPFFKDYRKVPGLWNTTVT